MKKIIITHGSLYNGGAERSLLNFLNLIDYKEYSVDLLLFMREGLFLPQVPKEVNILNTPDTLRCSYQKIGKDSFKNIKCFKVSAIRIIGTIVSKLMDNKKYKYRFKQIRWKHFYKYSINKLEKHYDVALSYLHGEPIYFVADKIDADIKIAWVHNDYNSSGFDSALDLQYFKKFDKIVSISNECVKILECAFPTIENKFVFVPNLTSSKFVKELSVLFKPEEFNIDKISLLSIGRLTYQKGFDIAIEAAYILKQRGYSFLWYILGDGELKDEMEKLIKKKSVEDCFILLGVRENPYVYMAECDIFVQTSRFEGKSMVLDEAKILAKPIVVTDYPTVHDQILNGTDGLIVSITAESIADGIATMINEPTYRQNFKNYLSKHEYGNQELIYEYYKLMK